MIVNELLRDFEMSVETERYERLCPGCKKKLTRKHHSITFCDECWRKHNKGEIGPYNNRARELVNYAVKLGIIPKASAYKCADCGEQAQAYDHRDYNKPLDVHPVCQPCNNKRGMGIPLLKIFTND